jgi:hypothetical protein
MSSKFQEKPVRSGAEVECPWRGWGVGQRAAVPCPAQHAVTPQREQRFGLKLKVSVLPGGQAPPDPEHRNVNTTPSASIYLWQTVSHRQELRWRMIYPPRVSACADRRS